MYSSVSAPRSSNGTPRILNSGLRCPEPTPTSSRPRVMASSVASDFASTSGWWYGSTRTCVSSSTRVVMPPR